jgi:hypothetical protein
MHYGKKKKKLRFIVFHSVSLSSSSMAHAAPQIRRRQRWISPFPMQNGISMLPWCFHLFFSWHSFNHKGVPNLQAATSNENVIWTGGEKMVLQQRAKVLQLPSTKYILVTRPVHNFRSMHRGGAMEKRLALTSCPSWQLRQQAVQTPALPAGTQVRQEKTAWRLR